MPVTASGSLEAMATGPRPGPAAAWPPSMAGTGQRPTGSATSSPARGGKCATARTGRPKWSGLGADPGRGELAVRHVIEETRPGVVAEVVRGVEPHGAV